MAGAPPPYPPPGAPFGYDPRQQRRFMREQARAQMRAFQAANRAQRDLYRRQTNSFRRTSILGPLIVIAIGVVFLLGRLGDLPFPRFAIWFAHWWPLLFVFGGIILLIEWAIDQHLATTRGIPVRRGLGAGTVFLLILIVLIGASVSAFHIHHGFSGYDMYGHNFGEFIGERHDRQQQLDGSVPAGATVEIEDPHGDVTVTGTSPDGQVHITVDKQIYSWTDEDADSKDRDLTAKMNLTGQTLRIEVPSISGTSADLTVSLPATSQSIVNAGRGTVNVSGMHAPVNVSSDHGDIELESITGTVTAHLNSSSSSFHADHIDGAVQLKGRGEDLTAADVSGPVALEGEFYGDTHLQNLRGGLSFKTNRTQFTLARVDGEVDISPNSELTGSQILGPTFLHTRSRNVSFERIAGDVTVMNSNGHVDISSALPLGNVTVENSNGDVEVTLPEKAGYTISAETSGGDIENDLGLSVNSVGEHQSATGKHGSGAAQINLRTTTADISLHEAAAVTLSSSAPTLPAEPIPPSTPKKPRKAAAPALKTETF